MAKIRLTLLMDSPLCYYLIQIRRLCQWQAVLLLSKNEILEFLILPYTGLIRGHF